MFCCPCPAARNKHNEEQAPAPQTQNENEGKNWTRLVIVESIPQSAVRWQEYFTHMIFEAKNTEALAIAKICTGLGMLRLAPWSFIKVLEASPLDPSRLNSALRSGHSHAASRYVGSRYPCHTLQLAAAAACLCHCSSVTHGVGIVTNTFLSQLCSL